MVTWNLSSLVKEEEFDEKIAQVRELANKVAKRELFADIPAKEFKLMIDELEKIDRIMGRLGSYANNLFSVDTNDQKAQSLVAKVRSLGAEIEQQLLFVSQEFKRLDEENAQRLIAACPEYKYHLECIRKGRKHMLSDEAEQIISIKDINGAGALSTIRSMITSNFEFSIDEKEVTQTEVSMLVKSPDAQVRRKAYDELLRPYVKQKAVLGSIYQHIIDDWRREAQLRKYDSSISVRNAQNDVPDKAVRVLLDVCKKNSTIFQEYFKKKAKFLGTEKLSRYDIYAPLAKEEVVISYDEAITKILETFKEFHPRFYEGAKRIIDEKHIDSELRKGKRGGAYCSTASPDVTPHVFLNFTNDGNSMRTLAHELGHGIHAILAEKENSFHQHAALPVCETASIFSEVLLNNKLREENPELVKEITIAQIDDFYATIMRQAWFVIFEEAAHEAVKDNLSIDEFSQIYKKQLHEQYGDMEIPEQFFYEWIYIPHIFESPFYCYAYSFGCLLSLALYAQYKKNPEFKEKIITMLERGGSRSPEELVKEAGFDICDETFWQAGMDVVKEMVDAIEN